MRNKKSFSFDEEKDAELIIVNGFSNNIIDSSKMYLVAKYFRQKFGYGEIRLERELLKFCKAQDKNFNPVIEADSIKRWIKSAMSYNLRKVISVRISKEEIEFLKSIEIIKDRKFLFVTLLLSKALKMRTAKRKQTEYKTSDNYYIRYNNLLDVIRLSKLTNISETDLADVYFKYKEHFTFYNAEKELIRLEYAKDNPTDFIEIEGLDKMIEHYDKIFGSKKESVKNCIVCGKELIKKSNRQKTCPDCSKEIRKTKQKELMRKRRNVSI